MTITPTTDTTSRRPVLIVGAGPGIGLAVARRFAQEGHPVGLAARSAERLESLAATLRDHDATVATQTADATDEAALTAAVDRLVADLGDPEVLCFSPLPDVGLIKPLLDTSPTELMASLALNVGGAATTAGAVLPALRRGGGGSLLFTTGSAALTPSPDRAASAVTTTAATTWIELLRQSLLGTDVRVGHTVVVGPVDATDSSAHHPDDVAAALWAQHAGPRPAEPTVLRR